METCRSIACVDDNVVEQSWQVQGELYSREWEGRRKPGQGGEGQHRLDR